MDADTRATDVVILGGGAAGLLCAIEAGKRGRSVVVIEHARRPAEKVRISGGGRCNFTNRNTTPAQFLSKNPKFAVSALARYTPDDFIAMVERHRIAYHEKKLGQLFCDDSSQRIIDMLLAECRMAGVTIQTETNLKRLTRVDSSFVAETTRGNFEAQSFVVATGGLSIPKMGATGVGYAIARQFSLTVVPTRPGLVPFTFSNEEQSKWEGLAGVSFAAAVRFARHSFRESVLFTHRGVSGPAILQISSYWYPPTAVVIDMAPELNMGAMLLKEKRENPKLEPASVLTAVLPRRLAQTIVEQVLNGVGTVRLGAIPDHRLKRLGTAINEWAMTPNGTEGFRIAEVTLGGVDTAELSSQTMESKKVPGLYFIGEVVDVTGHLGGYNFQWAWASGYAAGQVI